MVKVAIVDRTLLTKELASVDVAVDVCPNHHAIKGLIQRIEKKNSVRGHDVYVIGVTNVGKSTLINAIIKEITGDKDVITTSRFPGTTDKIEIPLDDGSYILRIFRNYSPDQMAHYLSAKRISSTLV